MKNFIILFFVFFTASSCSLYFYEQCEENNTKAVSGVIRKYNYEWYFIKDDGHEPLNFSSITYNDNCITVNYSFVAEKVLTFQVTPDEEFSSLGYLCGASVGIDHADIYIYQYTSDEIIKINPKDINSQWGNFWIYGLFK